MLVGLSVLVAALASPAAPLRPAPPEPASAAEPSTPRVLRPSFAGFDRGAPDAASERDAAAADLGLRPLGAGYRYEGHKGERFDAVIERDGTVRFELDPEVQATLDGVCAVGACKLTKKGRERHDKTRRRKRGTKAAMTIAALLAEAAAGTVTIGSTPWGYGTPVSGPIPGSSLGVPPPIPIVTAIGRYGYLPEPAIGMSDFMDRTFALRLQMKVDAAQADLVAAGHAHQARLDRLWTNPTLDAAARRTELLAMWSGIDTPPASSDRAQDGDAPLAEASADALLEARRKAAKDARAAIVKSVREHAPQGSPGAFSEVQLRRFNRGRTGADRFDPYASPSAPADLESAE